MTDTLTPAPEPDRFEHESPLRAFTDWQACGSYAIGKGLRPSAQHLPTYLDAIERKEGWRLVQMLLDDRGAFRSAIFRRDVADPIMPEVAAKADDPVNPRHYGGTACAEIGECLTANCYQVLKYCWRLGEKDDPCIELGKAIWYAERELALGLPASRKHGQPRGLKQSFVTERTEGSPWRTEIALLLWEMCYGFGTAPHWTTTANELVGVLKAKRAEMTQQCGDRGRGMEP